MRTTQHLDQRPPRALGSLLEVPPLGAEPWIHVALDVDPCCGEHLEERARPGALAGLERRSVPARAGLAGVQGHERPGQELVAAVHHRGVGRPCARACDGATQLLGELERLEHVTAGLEQPAGGHLRPGELGQAYRLVAPVADGVELAAAGGERRNGLGSASARGQRAGDVDPDGDRRPPISSRLEPLQRLLEEFPSLVRPSRLEAQQAQVVQGEGHEARVARPLQQGKGPLEGAPGLPGPSEVLEGDAPGVLRIALPAGVPQRLERVPRLAEVCQRAPGLSELLLVHRPVLEEQRHLVGIAVPTGEGERLAVAVHGGGEVAQVSQRHGEIVEEGRLGSGKGRDAATKGERLLDQRDRLTGIAELGVDQAQHSLAVRLPRPISHGPPRGERIFQRAPGLGQPAHHLQQLALASLRLGTLGVVARLGPERHRTRVPVERILEVCCVLRSDHGIRLAPQPLRAHPV